MKKIEKLTKEQEARLVEVREQWLKTGLSTKPINKAKLEKQISDFYQRIDKKPPIFFYFSSPIMSNLGIAALRLILDEKNTSQLWSQLRSQLWSQLDLQLDSQLRSQDYHYLWGQLDSYWIAFYKFALEVGVKTDEWCQSVLDGWGNIANECLYWWPKEGICVVSEKPTRIEMVNGELHADGKMSVEFSDGWGFYSNSGVRIPDKYGKVPIKDWEAKWLVEETNAEYRMILIKNIGYEKMFHELEAKKIDSWREYNLMRIDNVDVEPVNLLTMVCPSTNKTHVLRVPPDFKSARAAITACNKGIDPETFIVEH